MKEQKLILIFAHSLIGTGFLFLYVQHVRSIFESRTNIAHLTQLERESLIRREDALYYSFYKTLTAAPNFWIGVENLKNVTTVEYPTSVNVLQRFQLLPELVIGFLYHQMRQYGGKDFYPFPCWRSVSIRAPLQDYQKCDGPGQQMQFYLETVWLLGGLTILTIYMYGTLLSENIFGGVYAVLSYIIFHSYASKIYDRPWARENFAFPIIFLQMFYLCMCIDRVIEVKKHTSRFFVVFKLTILTALALACWQFSSVLFATQILIMMTPWQSNYCPPAVASTFVLDYTISQLLANVLAYYLSWGNRMYIFSWHIGPNIGLFFISMVRRFKHNSSTNEFSLKTIALGILMATSAQGTILDLLDKTGLARAVDNSFTLYRDLIIHWGLQAKVNFVTSLVACNPAYESILWIDIWELIKTLIVKPYCMYGVVMLAKFFRKWRKSGEKKTPSCDYIERAKKYVLEDFLEENRIPMQDMSNKETENELNEYLKLLEQCNYDYDKYKMEKTKIKKSQSNDHLEFINNIKKLKEQIHEINDKKNREKDIGTQFAKNESSPETTNIETTNNKPTTTNNKPSKTAEQIDCNKSEINGNNRRTRASKLNTKRDGVNVQQTPMKNKHDKNSSSSHHAGGTGSLRDSIYKTDIMTFHYLYSFLQMGIFTIIGLSVKKLFFLCFTQGCVIAPTICSRFCYRKQRNIFFTVSLAVFLTSMVNPGMENIREEYFPTRYTAQSDDLETMLEWIQMNTERDAVFAGPIDIIGTVHLATNRPIVNHAHLEMRQIAERTEHVYSIFSRQQSSDIYTQCSQLKIQYLIISLNDCGNEINDECDLLSIWDDMQPNYKKYPQFCSELLNKNIPSFLKVFTNEYYSIIKMFSQSVQINLKYTKMPEKVM